MSVGEMAPLSPPLKRETIKSKQILQRSNTAASLHPQSFSVTSQKRCQSQCHMDMANGTWSDNINSNPLVKPSPVPIILLLNKVDLFRAELLENPGKFHGAFEKEKQKTAKETQLQYEDRCIRAVRKAGHFFCSICSFVICFVHFQSAYITVFCLWACFRNSNARMTKARMPNSRN